MTTVFGWRFFVGLVASFFLLGSPWAAKTTDVCSTESFAEFVNRFGESTSLQRSATSIPLHRQRMDLSAQPEPKPIFQVVGLSQLKFPLLPSAADRQKASLVLDAGAMSNSVGKVTLRKPDTDYLVNYYFIRKACWTLVRVEDWSL